MCQEGKSQRQFSAIVLSLETPINFAFSPRKH